jgi:uncharacterized membrane protein YgdD (TMEM256/DUF423 family)
MNKRIILTAAFLGTIAVIFGAFGAHYLKRYQAPDMLSSWSTAVQYQFYHVFALLYLSTFARYKNRLINFSYLFFTLGIILFSGSLYLISMFKILQNHTAIATLGPITPIGGVCFIIGWICLFFAALKDK